MENRHDDSDGSNIFWPGYVDATTNLVLNLLFLITVMTVAVFMFALELGRTVKVEDVSPPAVSSMENMEEVSNATKDLTKENEELKLENARLKKEIKALKLEIERLQKENKELRLEIERLKKKLAELSPSKMDVEKENADLKREIERLKKMMSGGGVKSVDATSAVPKPEFGLDETATNASEIIVRFKDDAVAFTPAERDRLLETLKPVAESEQTRIFVKVPTGFSEAKRMGFYRAMAVRNLLIEMKMPKENITVSVVEGKNNASASLVRLRFY